MSTNLQIITDALRSINVIDETETPSAEQGIACLRQLNQMMAEWEVGDVVLGYFAQTSTADTCPVPDWAEGGVSGMLALRIAPDYGAQISIPVAAKADAGYSKILRTVINLKLKGANLNNLPVGSGKVGTGFDIVTG